jgi:hypothetical protein
LCCSPWVLLISNAKAKARQATKLKRKVANIRHRAQVRLLARASAGLCAP